MLMLMQLMMAVCKGTCLSAKEFSLRYDRPSDFVSSSCSVCRSPCLYAMVVTCLSVYSVTMSVYTGLTSDYGSKIFIWLTYWSYFALTGRFVLSAFNAWCSVIQQKRRQSGPYCGENKLEKTTAPGSDRYNKTQQSAQDIPVLYKAQWVLQNVSGTSALLVTGLYWTIMFDRNKPETVRSINSHIVNVVTVLTDMSVSRAPVRIQHCLHFFLFVTAYILFTAFYWAAGGLNHQGEDYIYPLLNYSRNPGRAVLVYFGVALLATPCLQALLYVVYRLREALVARYVDKVAGVNRSRTVTFILRSVETDGTTGSQAGHYNSHSKNPTGLEASSEVMLCKPDIHKQGITMTSSPLLISETSQIS